MSHAYRSVVFVTEKGSPRMARVCLDDRFAEKNVERRSKTEEIPNLMVFCFATAFYYAFLRADFGHMIEISSVFSGLCTNFARFLLGNIYR